jgi:putative nucleotidyltransferase-like protein
VVAASSRPTPSPQASELLVETSPLQLPAEATAQVLSRLPPRDSEGNEPGRSAGPIARPHAYRSLRLARELLALLDLFERHKVQAIPFKGPVLAVQLYGDLAARYYEDLDILVRERQFDQALALLYARGYEPSPELRRSPLARWLRLEGQCHLVRDAVRVELHFALGSFGFPVPLDFDALWSHLEPVRLGGRIVRTMSREDLALYLAAHGAKHAWERLEWIGDFAQLVRSSPDFDWLRIAARARAHGQERMLLLALRLASDLLGVPPPQALAARVDRDRRVRALASDVRRRLSDASRPFADQPRPVRWFHLRVMERLRDRVRYAGHVLFTPGPAEWAMLPLPGRLDWLSYVLRPMRIAGMYAKGLLKKGWAAMPQSLGSPPPR